MGLDLKSKRSHCFAYATKWEGKERVYLDYFL